MSRFTSGSSLLACLSFALLTACTPAAQGPQGGFTPATASGEIIGGIPASTQNPGHDSIVMLLGPQAGNQAAGQADFSTCTGVLIDENIVLTAAHCLKPLEKQLADFHDGRLPDLGSVAFAAIPGQTRRVTKFLVHENYVGQTWVRAGTGYVPRVDNDLGLAFFEGTRPKQTKIAKISDASLRQVVQAPLQIYGYGIDRLDPKSLAARDLITGQGRAAVMRLVPLLTVSLRAKLQPVLGDGLIIDQRNKPGICYGDSGGPAFQGQGSEARLVALHSHRTGLYKDDQGQEPLEAGILHECQYFSMMTPLRNYLPWIQKNIALLQDRRCELQPLFRQRVADLFHLKNTNLSILNKGSGQFTVTEVESAKDLGRRIDFQVTPNCLLPTANGPLQILAADQAISSQKLAKLRRLISKNPATSDLRIFAVLRRGFPEFQMNDNDFLSSLAALEGKSLQTDSWIIQSVAKGSDHRLWTQAESSEQDSQPLLEMFQIENAALEKFLSSALQENLKMRWSSYGLIGLRGSRQEIWITDPQTRETVIVQQTLFY